MSTILLPGDAIPDSATIPKDHRNYEQGMEVDVPFLPVEEPAKEDEKGYGPGFLKLSEGWTAINAGKLLNNPKVTWLQYNKKRYVPCRGEPVIGVIMAKTADQYRVDIGSAMPALLSNLAFEGATKRNKPVLNPGALVYARVTLDNRDMEPELECVSAINKSEGFGELKEGFMFKCSLGLCQKLIDKQVLMLKLIGMHVPYEIAVGMNGRVWVKSGSVKNTIVIVTLLQRCLYWDDAECKQQVKSFLTSPAAQ